MTRKEQIEFGYLVWRKKESSRKLLSDYHNIIVSRKYIIGTINENKQKKHPGGHELVHEL